MARFLGCLLGSFAIASLGLLVGVNVVASIVGPAAVRAAMPFDLCHMLLFILVHVGLAGAVFVVLYFGSGREGMTVVRATEATLDQLFEGVMVASRGDNGLPRSYPGWRCRRCGWVIGSIGLPPSHECPAEGERAQGKGSVG